MAKPTVEAIHATLKEVRLAKEQVRALRGADNPLGSPRRELIESAFWQLDEIEGDLLLRQIDEAVDELSNDAKSLVSLADAMKQSVKGLESVAHGIETAAKAVEIIVNTVQKVASVAGI